MKMKKIMIMVVCAAILMQMIIIPSKAYEVGKENILTGKSITSTGYLFGGGEWNLIDGNTGTNFYSPDAGGEVVVDLEGSKAIGRIELTSRMDMDQHQVHSEIEIHASNYEDFRTYDVIANTGDGFPAYSTWKKEVSSNKKYRYLRLIGYHHIALSEFAAYEKILTAEELAAEVITYSDVTDEKLLSKIGLVGSMGAKVIPDSDGNFNEDVFITRGEFAQYLCNVMGYNAPAVTENKLTDMDGNAAENAAELLYFLDIAEPYVADIFRPDLPMNTDDALMWCTKAIGYANMGDNSKGWYAAKAAELHLFKDMTKETDLSRKNAIILLYNLLFADALEIKNIEGGNVKYNKTSLLNIRKVYETTGVFEEYSKQSILKTEPAIAENMIIVGGNCYTVKNDSCYQYIGNNVKYYYMRDDKLGENVIIYMEKEKNQKEIFLKASQITNYQDYTLTYENTSDKKENLKFNAGTKILFNGRLLTEFVSSIYMMPTEGNIRFIDYDSNGIYDFIDIFSYNDYIVSGVNIKENRICFEDGKGMIGDKDAEIKVYVDGIPVDLNAIKAGNVISVGTSSDGKYHIIHVCDKKRTGKLTQYTDSDKNKIQINYIDEYEISKNFYGDNLNQIGKSGQLYFNYEGLLMKFDTEDYEVYGYGIVTGLYYEGGIRTEGEIAIYTKNKTVSQYIIKDGITIDGVNYKNTDEAVNILRRRVSNAAGNIFDENALIKYRVSTDGEVKEIDTVYIDAANEGQNSFRLCNTINNKYYYNGIFNGKVRLNNETIVYTSYGNSEDPLERYDVATIGIYSNAHSYSAKAYGTDSAIAAPVLFRTADTVSGINEYHNVLLVDKVIQGLNHSEETVPLICGMFQGNYVQYPLKSNDTLSFLSYVSRGDALRIAVDQYNQITAGEFMFNYEGRVLDENGNSLSAVDYDSPRLNDDNEGNGTPMAPIFYLYGGVYDIDDGVMTVKLGETNMEQNVNYDLFTMNFQNVYVCDINEKKATYKGDLNSLVTYKHSKSDFSRVLIRTNSGLQTELIIYLD